MELLLLTKVLLSLTLIIGVIYFCFIIAKKQLKLKAAKLRPQIQVIEHKRIDQKLTVSLLVVNDEYFVLAAGPNAIAMKTLKRSPKGCIQTKHPTQTPSHIH